MKRRITEHSQSRILVVTFYDKTAFRPTGLAGLDHISGISGGFILEGSPGVAVAVDEDVTAEGTYQAPTDIEHMRIGTPANGRDGDYELHVHNDLFENKAKTLSISLGGATDMAEFRFEIQLEPFIAPGNPVGWYALPSVIGWNAKPVFLGGG